MRSFSPEVGSDESGTPDPPAEERRGRQERRCIAPVPRGPGLTIPSGDKKTEAELLKTTVVVSSNPPRLSARELRTPSNIQLHEEVFVHFPQSAPNSPRFGAAAEARNGGEIVRSRFPTPQQSGCCSPRVTPVPRPKGPIQHEQDHDCCPFTAIRRSEWTLRTITKVHRTSPYDWTNLLSSFSVKNAFMFYPPPPTYGFFRDEEGAIQVRSETGKRAPRLDRERIEYVRCKLRMSRNVPDDLVAGALHGIASAAPAEGAGGGGGGDGGRDTEEDDSEPSFKLIFIPWENEVQSYYIRSGSVVFGRRVLMGHPLYALAWPCPIPCSIIRPHRRMSSHVAMFFHCNGEDIGRPSCLRLLTLANALHMTILVPEYPGYGLFEGNSSEASIKGSMERVIEFLFASDPSFTPSRLILIGHSIGTGVAMHVARFVNRVFCRLHDFPELNQQIPYACPMSTCQPIPTEYAAAVRCPPNSFVEPFSAVPATSPTEQIPPVAPQQQRGVRPLPHFTAPAGPIASAAHTNGDDGCGDAEDDSQCAPSGRDNATSREGHEGSTDAAATSAHHPGHTPLHAPYGRSGGARRRSGARATPAFLCPHYALGGVILLAPFASVRCVEKWATLKRHGFDVRELERRHLTVPEDVLAAAPDDWADDATQLRDTGEDPPNMDFLRPPSFLFDLARYVSFNRFPTIDVVRELQNEVNFFTHTPLLLLHGAQDVLIPAINSVAIASAIRQSAGGRAAKVYLGFLHNEGHNNLHCSHLTRRFYKDVILLPHLQAQRELRTELEETLRNGLGQSNATHNTDSNAFTASKRVDSTSSSANAAALPPPAEMKTRATGAGCAGDEPSVFDVPPPPSPPPSPPLRSLEQQRRAPLLRSPTTATNRTTEPIDEEQPELPTAASSRAKTPDNGEQVTTTTAVAAAADGGGAEADPGAPALRQTTEPYLYFIEPAYAEEGATWMENGNFAGPVRIRLLHPPQQRNFMSELAHQAACGAPDGTPDANVFVTRTAEPALVHAHHHHHQRHRSGHVADAGAAGEDNRDGSKREGGEAAAHRPSRGLPAPTATPHPLSSAALVPHSRRSSGAMPYGVQTCRTSEQFEDALRDTLHHTQPPDANFAPAATMLHIALFHHLDHYDVGSIAVASVTKYSVDAAVALRQWQRFRRNHFILRCCTALFYFSAGSLFISLAICHGVLTRPARLRPYLPVGTSTYTFHPDARVVIWGVLEGFAYLLLGVVRFFHSRLGVGNLSKYMDTPSSVLWVYAACRVTAYVLCAGVGIFMAMILALTPADRGGVDWARWSELPYSRRVWISYLPRWTMVASASMHMFFLIAIFLKNH